MPMILVGKQDIVRLSSISPKDREHRPRGFYGQAQVRQAFFKVPDQECCSVHTVHAVLTRFDAS
jgi:hypothetical protein